MKRLAYGVLSSLLILATTIPVGAETSTTLVQSNTVAQSNSATIDQMFRQQKVLADEIQALMAQMKTMMAEMKALTALPDGQTPTMADLYKQQQRLITQVEALTNRTKLETIQPRKSTATVQDVHQQQVTMMAEMKAMMAEIKSMSEVYRGRAGSYKP